ncbi:OLC1v1035258C1 [Oldenlandia corymbosa var. corymbosa]|uniref:OLC1v1035258C1 n=1 Tax=Oldenlandia corymbosa var. corymbosa TaxID=529605 RepID=A0AAV1CSI6_OLDCO|nr:OLC1v1035258C1 [Oldenlandia corymbosa var. corymbosa]
MPGLDGGGTGCTAGSLGLTTNNRAFPAAWGLVAAKPCDYCHTSSAILFCKTDSAFLCMNCDAKMHAATKIGSRHERVWMCEVCEQAPAVVTCKADAAALCVSCDRDIHSANPLARRHERIPVVPFYETAESVVKSTAASFLLPPPNNNIITPTSDDMDHLVNVSQTTTTCVAHDFYPSHDAAGAVSAWTNQKAQTHSDAQDIKSMEFLFSESDNYLDFDCPSFQNNYSAATDGVVPVQTTTIKPQFLPCNNPTEKHFEIDFTKSNISSYNHHSYHAASISHSVSSSSLDVGVVPDGSSMSEISYPFGQSLSSSVDLGGGASSGSSNQGVGLDREARVLRYREKRKNRKFEKTIRYASRKAYAETRPRIKGRFAKRTETIDSDDIDRMLCTSPATTFFPESRYGVVPSF